MKRNILLAVMSFVSLIAMAQITFEEKGIVYMEDLSDPSKMAGIVMPKKSPLTQDKSLYSGNITIPSHIKHDLDDYEVVGISYGAFYSDKIESLNIEDGVQYIADYAIYSPSLKKLLIPGSIKTLSRIIAENLEEVEIGEGVETINEVTFGNVKSLKLPKSLKEINGLSVFGEFRTFNTTPLPIVTVEFNEGVQRLNYCMSQFGGEKLSLPSSCLYVSNSFYDCPNLYKIEFKGGIDSLQESFRYVRKISELTLANIKIIQQSFEECDNLHSLILGEGITHISKSFLRTPNLEILYLPNSLTTIDGSFVGGYGQRLDNLKTIKFGLGFNNIRYFIDYSNNCLKEIYCPWKEIPAAPEFSYDYMKGLKQLKIYVPKGMSKDYQSAWGLENWEGILFVEHF